WRGAGPRGAGTARRRGAGGPLPPLLSPLLLLLWLLPSPGAPEELNPRGRNVCRASGSQEPMCCAGWKQQGDECGIAVCEGNSTCSENEVCVRPGECRCRHGYFGANCDTKCPRQFWGPDCKELCICHPHGQCEDVTGQCTCHARRWGARCEHACQCQHGACHPRSGACRCEPGWWGAQCSSACYCSTSRCDPQTARAVHAGCELQLHISARAHVQHKRPFNAGGTLVRACTVTASLEGVRGDCVGSSYSLFPSGAPPRYGERRPRVVRFWPQLPSLKGGTCDPVTGAAHGETNQRKGVMGAGALLAMLLGLLLSLLGCCCACRGKDPAHRELSLGRKKPPQRLCGRFSRISMKLPRIPLRRQKLPKVVVAHHDLDNTLNCSFLEPPSGLEQPSPSWSSRASFSSFDTTDEGPVYCVPHEEAATESRDREVPTAPAEAQAPAPAPVFTPAPSEEATPLP
uniref:EGF-like domain-containing protein n=1 Tax=Myotis lucifugus TaxID=59463 RepID=G1P836_MYOLU